MSRSSQPKQFDAKQAKEVGDRLRILLGNESVTSFASRLGISRQWLHGILAGQVPREASVATLSSISDTLGYSLEWLVTGKGMPNEEWTEKTTLVARVVPQLDARQNVTFVTVEGGATLVPNSFLPDIEATAQWGVLKGEHLHPGSLVGESDEFLVDLKDHKLVNKALFLVQVQKRLLAARAIRAQRRTWLLSPTENITPDALIDDPRILGRIRLVLKRA